MGKWILECPKGGVYEGEGHYHKENGVVLEFPQGLKKLHEPEGGGCVENPAKPIRVIRGKKTYVEVFRERETCHPSSFRVIKPNPLHLLTICCPREGEYDPTTERCLVGTRPQKMEHLHRQPIPIR